MNCLKFNSLLDEYIDGDCTELQKSEMDMHCKSCSSCAAELAFARSIRNSLHSLPKISAPDDFLQSLNQKLDRETQNKIVFHRTRLQFVWKKYSAAAACLLLAVMAGADVFSPQLQNQTEPVISQIVSVSDAVTQPENISEPSSIIAPVNVSPTPAPIDLPKVSAVSRAPEVKVSLAPSKQASADIVVDPKSEAEKITAVDIDRINHSANAPAKEFPKPEPLQTPVASDKVVVVKPSTPHSSVELPIYMDDKDSIIMAPAVKNSSSVRLDDYEVVATDELLQAFSLAEIPQNKVIVANPTTLSSAQTLSIKPERDQDINLTGYGGGGGSLFVSVDDEEVVEGILDKYYSHESDMYFLLTSENYDAFTKELKKNDIAYHDYMISTNSSNISFKLMVS